MMSKKNRIALIQRALTLTSGLSTAKAAKSRVIRNSVLAAGAFAASAAFAQSPAAAPAAEPVYELEALTTTGEGMSRATNSITAADARLAVPAASVETLLKQVPGVNVTNRDPFGFYEFGNDIRVRSFGINQVAVSIDDVPMGNNSPRFGLPAGRVADSENISLITVSQGVGDVTTPAYEALGGSIKYYTADATPEMGVHAKASIGSFDLSRQYVKVNTGEIVPGVAAWVSGSSIRFKSANVPEYSEGNKVESKVNINKGKFKGFVAYTYNERDDYDTATTRFDYFKAMSSRNAEAVYPLAFYRGGLVGGNTTVIQTLANKGLANYTYSDFSSETLATLATSGDIAGALNNYSDGLRNVGPANSTVTGITGSNGSTTLNPGDGYNARFYEFARNGRQDNFFRAKGDVEITESITLTTAGYFQDRQYYGTASIPRGDARTQIIGGYRNVPARTDIWPQLAYRVGNQLVLRDNNGALPAGAVPATWTDTNSNGMLDFGEQINYTATATEYLAIGAGTSTATNPHAIVGRGSTTASVTPGIPGHTARFERFGGDRYGGLIKGKYEQDIHTFTTGFWYEKDEYYAIRPQYNLLNGSFTGPYLFNQMLFNNYDRNLDSTIINAFVDYQVKLMDNRLNLNVGAKALYGQREVEGLLNITDWLTNTRKTRGPDSNPELGVYEDFFLPQLGAAYKLNQYYEVFAGYAESYAMPTSEVLMGLNDPNNATDAATLQSAEASKNYEAGIRYAGESFGATLTLFLNQYSDRIGTQSLSNAEQQARGIASTTGSTYYINAGSIDASGAELGTEWKTPIEGLKVAFTGSYLKSTFETDIPTAYQAWMNPSTAGLTADQLAIRNAVGNMYVLPTAVNAPAIAKIQGKRQIGAPEFGGRLDVTYSIKNWSTTFGTEYRDSVYLNAFNTEELDSFINNSLNVSWRGTKGSKMEPFTVSLSVTNLFDRDIYYSAAGGSSPVAATLWGGAILPDYGRNLILSVEAKF